MNNLKVTNEISLVGSQFKGKGKIEISMPNPGKSITLTCGGYMGPLPPYNLDVQMPVKTVGYSLDPNNNLTSPADGPNVRHVFHEYIRFENVAGAQVPVPCRLKFCIITSGKSPAPGAPAKVGFYRARFYVTKEEKRMAHSEDQGWHLVWIEVDRSVEEIITVDLSVVKK